MIIKNGIISFWLFVLFIFLVISMMFLISAKEINNLHEICLLHNNAEKIYNERLDRLEINNSLSYLNCPSKIDYNNIFRWRIK